MSLKLHQLTTEEEFLPVAAVEKDAFENPWFGFWQCFNGPSVEELSARQFGWHKDDPSSHWMYVTDETGEVLGAAQWNVYEENPYAKEVAMLTPYWQPEGTFKDIATQLLYKFLSYRPVRMNEPHILLNFCFTHSQHRRRGVGRLLMEWGVKKADELGLPAYIEASDQGLELYKAYGFKVKGDVDLDATAENPSEEFIKIRQNLGLPMHGWFMHRPKYGKD